MRVVFCDGFLVFNAACQVLVDLYMSEVPGREGQYMDTQGKGYCTSGYSES